MPEISVIVPAYNTAKFIAQCLDSVFAQTYSDFEVIVVNDGSPDTPELEQALAPYLDRIVYIKQANKRAAGARNTAIQRAQGNLLAFLDSDDLWFPGHLAAQMEQFQRQPQLDLVYADGLVGDGANEWRFMDRCPSHGEATFSALVVERCQIPISTVVVRRAAIVKAGLFDEALPCFDDYDMWLRTAFYGGKIGYTRELQVRARGRRPGSLSESVHKIVAAYWSILEKALQTLPLSQAHRDIIVARLKESKAMFQLEEAKRQLQMREFSRASQLLREANRHLRRPDVKLALIGLRFAPAFTCKAVETWGRLGMGR